MSSPMDVRLHPIVQASDVSSITYCDAVHPLSSYIMSIRDDAYVLSGCVVHPVVDCCHPGEMTTTDADQLSGMLMYCAVHKLSYPIV